MRIAQHQGAQCIVAPLAAPHLCPSDEEPLLASEAIEHGGSSARQRLVGGELFRDPRRTCLIVGGILCRPSVAQLTLGVRSAALIVEAMAHLVADDGTDRPPARRLLILSVQRAAAKLELRIREGRAEIRRKRVERATFPVRRPGRRSRFP